MRPPAALSSPHSYDLHVSHLAQRRSAHFWSHSHACCSSHQFWHVCVVVAAYLHFCAMMQLWDATAAAHFGDLPAEAIPTVLAPAAPP